MNIIAEAREALNIDPVRLTRVVNKYKLDDQEAVEQIAYRRAVLDRGGVRAERMAEVILGR